MVGRTSFVSSILLFVDLVCDFLLFKSKSFEGCIDVQRKEEIFNSSLFNNVRFSLIFFLVVGKPISCTQTLVLFLIFSAVMTEESVSEL